jgi:CRISPR-associated endonuclease Cas3-HD
MKYKLPKEISEALRKGLGKYYKNKPVPEERLSTHTAKLLEVMKIFFKMFNDKHPIREDLLKIAILYHDIGKCEKNWLANKKDVRNELAIRHEVLSFLITSEYLDDSEDFSNYEKLMILMPILLHHNSYFVVEGGDIFNFEKINQQNSKIIKKNKIPIEWDYGLGEYRNFKKVAAILNRDLDSKNRVIHNRLSKIIQELSKDITKEQEYEIQYHCMLLCAIDQLASGWDSNEKISEDDIKKWFDIDFKISNNYKGITPRDYQKYVIDTYDESTDMMFVDFRPGAGKTLITEYIAQKLNRTIVHATPKNIISNDLAEKFISDSNFEIEKSDEYLESLDASEIRNRHKWFTKQKVVLYTTPDNIFLMSQGYKRHFLFLRLLYKGILVLDEFHDCVADEYRRTNLRTMLKKFLYFKIKIILLSGTTPKLFVNEMMEHAKKMSRICHFITDKGGSILHQNNLERDIKDTGIPTINKIKGIIKFCDMEPSDEVVSGSIYGNKNRIEIKMGYYPYVKKVVDQCVANDESLAICLGSKEGIFHLMHLLSPDYKFKEDYIVVCSPRMVNKNYRHLIEEALKELKKENIGKSRKYKFIICTSYTEMGVDFSVKNMILEMGFLFNIDQQLGRLNRWGEFGDKSVCHIVPPITRFSSEDLNYILNRYQGKYQELVRDLKNKDGIVIDSKWYSQTELDKNFEWLMNDNNTSVPFLNVCGIFRASSADQTVNGMYREVITREYKWESGDGETYEVPAYRFDQNGKLNVIPHPDLFI